MTAVVTSGDVETILIGMFQGQNVEESNQFLLQFVELDVAWEIAMNLFSSKYSFVQYFSANIIYTKVLKHWSKLNMESRASLFSFLRDQLCIKLNEDVNGSIRPFLNRICLALAAVCCRSPGAATGYIEYALSLIQGINKPEERWALEMLAVLPDEAEKLDSSRALKLELEQQLSDLLPKMLQLIDSISIAVASVPKGSEGIVRSVLLLMKSWMRYGINLQLLGEEHPRSLELILSMFSNGDRPCIIESCSVLYELFHVGAYPRPASRTALVLAIITGINQSIPRLRCFFTNSVHDDENEEVAVAICNTFASIAVLEIELFVSPAAQQCLMDFLAFILHCASQRPRKVASETFEIWVQIADVAAADRPPYTTQALCAFCDSLFGLLVYPPGFTSWSRISSEIEDEDDFTSFRNPYQNGIDEILAVCLYSLGDNFFAIINCKIEQVVANLIPFDWKPVEAVCYMLQFVGSAVKAAFLSNSLVVDYLRNLIRYLLQLPMDVVTSHTELHTSIVLMLKSYTFFIANPTSIASDLFPAAIEFLFRCICQSDAVAATAAAKAVIQYFVHGCKFLIINTTADAQLSATGSTPFEVSALFQQCIKVASALVVDPVRAASHRQAYIHLLDGICKVLSQLPLPQATELTMFLATGLLEHLQMVVSSPPTSWTIPVVTSQLSFFCCIIKNSNRTDVATNQSGQLCIALCRLLLTLHPVVLNSQLESVAAGIFDCYANTILALNIEYTDLIVEISMFAATALQSRICCSAALNAATTITSVIASHEQDPGIRQLLLHHWTGINRSLLRSPHQNQWLQDPQILEEYLQFVRTFMNVLPDEFVESEDIESIANIVLFALQQAFDKNSLRAALIIVQQLFCSNFTDVKSLRKMLALGCQMGPQLVAEILDGLDGKATSMMRKTLIDALYAILLGCLTGNFIDECKQWVSIPVSEKNWTRISPANKAPLVLAMFEFAASDKRRFTALLLDIAKISNGEQSEDCLCSYFDPMS